MFRLLEMPDDTQNPACKSGPVYYTYSCQLIIPDRVSIPLSDCWSMSDICQPVGLFLHLLQVTSECISGSHLQTPFSVRLHWFHLFSPQFATPACPVAVLGGGSTFMSQSQCFWDLWKVPIGGLCLASSFVCLEGSIHGMGIFPSLAYLVPCRMQDVLLARSCQTCLQVASHSVYNIIWLLALGHKVPLAISYLFF